MGQWCGPVFFFFEKKSSIFLSYVSQHIIFLMPTLKKDGNLAFFLTATLGLQAIAAMKKQKMATIAFKASHCFELSETFLFEI